MNVSFLWLPRTKDAQKARGILGLSVTQSWKEVKSKVLLAAKKVWKAFLPMIPPPHSNLGSRKRKGTNFMFSLYPPGVLLIISSSSLSPPAPEAPGSSLKRLTCRIGYGAQPHKHMAGLSWVALGHLWRPSHSPRRAHSSFIGQVGKLLKSNYGP